MGYTGYPAAIFIERMNFGYGSRSHMENKMSLEKWYSALVSYLPVLYADKKKTEEFEKEIAPLLHEIVPEIEATHQLYRDTFEDLGTCSPEEKEFILAMRGVFERLDRITAMTHVIDGVRPDDDVVVAG